MCIHFKVINLKGFTNEVCCRAEAVYLFRIYPTRYIFHFDDEDKKTGRRTALYIGALHRNCPFG